MKSSSAGSAPRYRGHNGSETHTRPHTTVHRESGAHLKGEYIAQWSTPPTTPGPNEYGHHGSHGYGPPPIDTRSVYENSSHVVAHHIPASQVTYAIPQSAVHATSPLSHPQMPVYGFQPPPSPQIQHPPTRQHSHHYQTSSYSNSSHHTHAPYAIEASPVSSHHHQHNPRPAPSLHERSQSDVSQYSLSRYKPSKPRFRIEHEGKALVVLPPRDDDSVPSTPSSPRSPIIHQIEAPPPKRWPPTHYQTDLSEDEAKDYIANGAPKFRGELREISYGPRGHYHFFAFAGQEWDENTDTAAFQCDGFGDMSSTPEGKQTDALERPAMAHAFGIYPGTCTLAYYIAGFGTTFKGDELASRTKVRKLAMIYVLDRLRHLQIKGIEEDIRDAHHVLYEYLLHDGHKYDYAEANKPTWDGQIGDLVGVLCRPSWVDFSIPENQTVAQFLNSDDPSVSNSFFHQLLLSIELYLRIKQKGSASKASVEMMPEKIRWDIMLAQRWLENVEIEPPRKVKSNSRGEGPKSSVGFKFPNKKNQIDALREFAWCLKWPNMRDVEETLEFSEQDDPDNFLEDRSTNCMAWFTGLLLPGKSMPFILMNALVECDGETPPEFKNFNQTVSNIGFQYRGCTFWSWECIVGKVLGAAAGVTQIAGWIGPCSASADLERSEVALINQSPPRCNRITEKSVRRMEIESDPLGPEDDDSYPISNYDPVVASSADPVDSIRIERINFAPSSSNPAGVHRQALEETEEKPIIIFDASITFAITVDKRARSWKVSLRHDTPFIAAYPCQNGPHVLFVDYVYKEVRVDELVEIANWGTSGNEDSDSESETEDIGDVSKVLVIEAYGVPDNEVFARAWCSFWGLPSVTADISKTCMSCAIREAYAALVSVVILVDRTAVDIPIEEVDRLMENL